MPPELYSLDFSFPLDNTNIHVLQISRGTIEQVPIHSHGTGTYEIHYLPYGYGTAMIDSKQYSINPNTLYVTGPFVAHSQISSPGTPIFEYCLNLKVDPVPANTPLFYLSSRFLTKTIWYGHDNHGLLTLLQQIFQELKEKRLGYMHQVQSLLVQCIIALLRNYDNSPTTATHEHSAHNLSDTHLRSNKTLLAENYFLFEYDHLSLKELADILGFSIRQTQRFLLNSYGKTFREKKKESRMAAALLLLSTSNETITSISEKLGFASMEYFSCSFKHHFGISPQEYRKSLPQEEPITNSL